MASRRSLNMQAAEEGTAQKAPIPSEHIDVLIVGAGLSGIGVACHLKKRCPSHNFSIFEARDTIGGTWDLFRYPGVRSDTALHVLGYEFKPWTGQKSIASGASIKNYIQETVDEYELESRIRFGLAVNRCEWSTKDARWTVTAERTVNPKTGEGGGDNLVITANFLIFAAGYYSYKEGYTPAFTGRERFKGTIVHPQEWPEDLDYAGKRVLVVGSGATAMTLVPAMAETASHVTMLQRSPTFVFPVPDEDKFANMLYRWLPQKLAYSIIRWKSVKLTTAIYRYSKANPEKMKEALIAGVAKQLPPGFDVDKHFRPRYMPWDQRLCVVTNGDLFKAINEERASMVTDEIDTFTEKGIRLKSGETLEADIIVTATGLNIVMLGETDTIPIIVDGKWIDFSKVWAYKGFAFSGVPNLILISGYINNAWTLRVDLISRYACRLLTYMASKRMVQCTPRLRPSDEGMPEAPYVPLSSGFFARVMDKLPKMSDREPWMNKHDYYRDCRELNRSVLEDGVMQFTKSPDAGATTSSWSSCIDWKTHYLIPLGAAAVMLVISSAVVCMSQPGFQLWAQA